MTDRFVLLPGMDGTGELFRPFIRALPPGSVASVASYPRDRELSYAELCPYVEQAVPTEPYVLVAESFSGPLAVLHAAAKPPMLRALVLCASFIESPVPRFLRWAEALVSPTLFRVTPPRPVVRALLTGAGCSSGVLDDLRAVSRLVRPSVLSHRLTQVLAVDVGQALSSVSAPVLYLAGSRDRLVGMRGMRQVMHRLPGAGCSIVKGPHLLLQCHPGACVREILEFVSRTEQGHHPGP